MMGYGYGMMGGFGVVSLLLIGLVIFVVVKLAQGGHENKIEIEYKNISEKQNRDELKNKYKRMAVPTIVIGNRVILGFAENRDKITEILKL